MNTRDFNSVVLPVSVNEIVETEQSKAETQKEMKHSFFLCDGANTDDYTWHIHVDVHSSAVYK